MRIKRFSATKILNTNSGLGFIKGRKYDTDLDRLGRNSTQRELHQTNQLHTEMRKLNSELNQARLGKWTKDFD